MCSFPFPASCKNRYFMLNTSIGWFCCFHFCNLLYSLLEMKIDYQSVPTLLNNSTVIGCKYKAQNNPASTSYLLLNGSIRLNYSETSSRGQTPNFTLTSYRQRGFFQCAMFNPKYRRTITFSNESSYISLNGKYGSEYLRQIDPVLACC